MVRIDKKTIESTESGSSSTNTACDNNNNMSSSDDSDRNSEAESDVEDSMKSSELNNSNVNIFSPTDSLTSSKSCCNCVCHSNGPEVNGKHSANDCSNERNSGDLRGVTREAAVQTLSTGDIVITKVYFPDSQQ